MGAETGTGYRDTGYRETSEYGSNTVTGHGHHGGHHGTVGTAGGSDFGTATRGQDFGTGGGRDFGTGGGTLNQGQSVGTGVGYGTGIGGTTGVTQRYANDFDTTGQQGQRVGGGDFESGGAAFPPGTRTDPSDARRVPAGHGYGDEGSASLGSGISGADTGGRPPSAFLPHASCMSYLLPSLKGSRKT